MVRNYGYEGAKDKKTWYSRNRIKRMFDITDEELDRGVTSKKLATKNAKVGKTEYQAFVKKEVQEYIEKHLKKEEDYIKRVEKKQAETILEEKKKRAKTLHRSIRQKIAELKGQRIKINKYLKEQPEQREQNLAKYQEMLKVLNGLRKDTGEDPLKEQKFEEIDWVPYLACTVSTGADTNSSGNATRSRKRVSRKKAKKNKSSKKPVAAKKRKSPKKPADKTPIVTTRSRSNSLTPRVVPKKRSIAEGSSSRTTRSESKASSTPGTRPKSSRLKRISTPQETPSRKKKAVRKPVSNKKVSQSNNLRTPQDQTSSKNQNTSKGTKRRGSVRVRERQKRQKIEPTPASLRRSSRLRKLKKKQ